jgi:hypothetical protein
MRRREAVISGRVLVHIELASDRDHHLMTERHIVVDRSIRSVLRESETETPSVASLAASRRTAGVPHLIGLSPPPPVQKPVQEAVDIVVRQPPRQLRAGDQQKKEK